MESGLTSTVTSSAKDKGTSTSCYSNTRLVTRNTKDKGPSTSGNELEKKPNTRNVGRTLGLPRNNVTTKVNTKHQRFDFNFLKEM